MSVVEELLRTEADGKISFGNHTLQSKKKKEDFVYAGDIYKVKTCAEITKLEKNGMFLYESVPGTSVNGFAETENSVLFTVTGNAAAQITVGLKTETEYEVYIRECCLGTMKSGFSGKLNLSVELEDGVEVPITITEA